MMSVALVAKKKVGKTMETRKGKTQEGINSVVKEDEEACGQHRVLRYTRVRCVSRLRE